MTSAETITLALVLLLCAACLGCAGPSTLTVGGGQGVAVGTRLALAPAHLVHDGHAQVDGQTGRVVAWLAASDEPWALLEVDRPLLAEPVELGAPEPGDSGAPVVSRGRLLGLVVGRTAGSVVVSTLDQE
jgi:hypothetical protein